MTDIRDSKDVRRTFDRPETTKPVPLTAAQANPQFAIAPGTFPAPGTYTVNVIAPADASGVWTISRAENKQNLDGTMPITPTPFDAHEQVVRGPHTHSLKDGYQPLARSAADVTVDAEPSAPPPSGSKASGPRDETAAEEKTREAKEDKAAEQKADERAESRTRKSA